MLTHLADADGGRGALEEQQLAADGAHHHEGRLQRRPRRALRLQFNRTGQPGVDTYLAFSARSSSNQTLTRAFCGHIFLVL